VTILEYIDRLDASLEEINAGSSAITKLITSVDDAAGQSATTSRHMNSSMDAIRERNAEIGTYNETTRQGVSNLNRSMIQVERSLSQFRIEETSETDRTLAAIEDLKKIQSARKVLDEDEMKALETSKPVQAIS